MLVKTNYLLQTLVDFIKNIRHTLTNKYQFLYWYKDAYLIDCARSLIEYDKYNIWHDK